MKWSISAHNCFRRCQRQYYFSKIMAAHNASDERRREAHILAQLKSLSAWRGNLVDKGIERFVIPALENGIRIDFDRATQQTIGLAHRQLAFSKAKKYRETGTTKKDIGDEFCALFCHEYGQDISPEKLESLPQDIACCFRNLERQTGFMGYLRQGKRYRTQERLSFYLDEVIVVAWLDLLFFGEAGQLTIVDWKTGVSETSHYRPQLLVYALAAVKGWPKAQSENLEIYEANLMKNKIRRHHVTEQDLLGIEDFIYSSICEIRSLTQDKKFQDQHPEDYEFANSSNTCKYCSFRKLCLEVLSEDASDQLIQDYEPVQLELLL